MRGRRLQLEGLEERTLLSVTATVEPVWGSQWVDTYPTLAADVDADGMTDLIFRDYQSGTQVLTLSAQADRAWDGDSQNLGWGSGWFNQHLALTGDFDGDGDTDFTVRIDPGSNYDGTVQTLTFLSQGNGQWSVYRNSTGLDSTWIDRYPALAADVNGDGRTDLILRNCTPGVGMQVRTLLSDGDHSAGTGTWTQIEQAFGWGSGWFNQHPALTGDFDGDGNTDFTVYIYPTSASGYDDAVQVLTFLSDGHGNWTTVRRSSGLGQEWIEPHDALAGDVNGDGLTDLVFRSTGGGVDLLTMTANGDGSWTNHFHSTGLAADWVEKYPALTGDVDGDGDMDLILRNYQSSVGTQLLALLSQGDGDQGEWIGDPQNVGWGSGWFNQNPAQTGDFNGDGRTDVLVHIVSESYGDDVQLLTFYAEGDGSWRSALAASLRSVRDDQTPYFDVGATAEGGTVVSLSAEVKRGATIVGSWPTVPSPWPHRLEPSKDCGLGTYVVTVTAEDQSGAQDTAKTSYRLTDDDSTPPEVLLGGSSGTQSEVETQLFTWDVTDPPDADTGVQSESGSSVDVSITKDGEPEPIHSVTGSSELTDSFPFDSFGPGTYMITVTATDGDADRADDASESVPVTRTVVVLPRPVVVADVVQTPEDTPALLTVLDNDTGADGLALAIVDFTLPGHGTLVDNGDGTLTYTPDPDYFGTDGFEYTASDVWGGTDTAQVSIDILPVNDAPDFTASNPPAVYEDSGTHTLGWAKEVFVRAGSGGLNTPAKLTFGPDGHLYVSSSRTREVLRYDGTTGDFMDVFVASGTDVLNMPRGLRFGPDGHLYVCSYGTNEVLRYDGASGTLIGAFVSAGSGGLYRPMGLLFHTDGNLYVTSHQSSAVLRYNGTTGAYLDTFVSARSGGLDTPDDLTFGPDGKLYVSDWWGNTVLRFDGATGAYVDTFLSAGGAGFDRPRSMLFGPDGNFYVASENTNEILRYDPATGDLIDAFVSAGGGGLDRPFACTFGPDDNLYVCSLNSDEILRYDGTRGAFDAGSSNESNQSVLKYTVTNVSNPGLFTILPTVTPDGMLSYRPAPNANGSSTFKVAVQDDGGTANGGVDTSAAKTFKITVLPVNDAPDFTASNPPAVNEDSGTHTFGWAKDVFVPAGSGGLNAPAELTFGPDGHLYVAKHADHSILRYDGTTGEFMDVFVASGTGGLNIPRGLRFGLDGHLYVCSYGTSEVLRYDGASGTLIGAFVSAGSGGLYGPLGLVFHTDGNLYVTSYSSGAVLRYNGTTGAYVDTFVSAGSGGLNGPIGLTFGPDGKLYVAGSHSDNVLRFDGATGAYVDTFLSAGGAGFDRPRSVLFGPDGNFYVASENTNEILRYDPATGDLIDAFVSASGGGLDRPFAYTFGPDDNLYVCSLNTDEILRYDGTRGAFDAGSSNESGQSVLKYIVTSVSNPGLFQNLKVTPDGMLSYQPAPNANGSSTFKVAVQDDGGTANGGVDTSAAKTFKITVLPVNDAPVVSAPSRVSGNQGTSVPISGISIADVDAGGGQIRVAMGVGKGELTLASRSGLTFTRGDGVNDLAMTFAGTRAQVNTALKTLSYRRTSSEYGRDDLKILAVDLGNTGAGGSLQDDAWVEVWVNPVVQMPYNAFEVYIRKALGDTEDILVKVRLTQTVFSYSPYDLADVRGISIFTNYSTSVDYHVNCDNLSDATLPDGISIFAGDGGNDRLHVYGSQTYTNHNYKTGGDPNSGTITVDGLSIYFDGFEPIIDELTVEHRSFTIGTSDDLTVRVTDDGDPANGMTTIDSAGTNAFEWITFVNPTSSLTIDGDAPDSTNERNDTIVIESVDPGFDASMRLIAGDGDDDVDAFGFGGDLTIEGGSGRNNLRGGTGSTTIVGGPDDEAIESQGGITTVIGGGGVNSFTDGGGTTIFQTLPGATTPDVFSDQYQVTENNVLTVNAAIGVLFNDVAPSGATLHAVLVESANHGVVVLDPDGGFLYTPGASFVGEDTFAYRAENDESQSDPAIVTIAVLPENNGIPVADAQAVSAVEDTRLEILLTGEDGDSDVTQTLGCLLVDGPDHGALSALNAASGSVVYIPTRDYQGTDSFAFQVFDGRDYSDPATVQITVEAVNDVPEAEGVYLATEEDTTVEFDLRSLAGDIETTDDDLVFAVGGADNGSVSLLADGYTARFEPAADYHGPAGFTYDVTDTGDGPSAAITISDVEIAVEVSPVNDAPTVDVDHATVAVDEGDTAENSGTFADVEQGDSVTITASSGVIISQGTGNSGAWTWSSNASDGPEDGQEVTITATDGDLAVGTVTFDLEVNNVAPTATFNSPPEAVDEGSPINLSLTSPSDPSSVDTAAGFEYAFDFGDGYGVFSTTTHAAFSPPGNGTRTVKARIRDKDGGETEYTTVVTVNNVAPVADEQSVVTDEDASLAITLTGSDAGEDSLTYTVVAGPSHGVLGGTGEDRTYTPSPDYNGPDSFTFRANDGEADSDEATVTITVNPVNDAPLAEPDVAITDEDVAVTIGVVGNDTDVDDGAVLTVLSASDGSDGSVTLEDNGTDLTYSPNLGFEGTDTFEYTVQDEHGATATAEVTVTVNNLVDLSGRVFDDLDNDGIQDTGEPGILGVTVTLYGGSIPLTRTTDANGEYDFDDANLGPGTYSIVETQPADYLDADETAPATAPGGTVNNDEDCNEIANIEVTAGDLDASGYLFAEILSSHIQGMVWEDFNNDGGVNFGEKAIDGVTVTLTGTDDRGNAVGLETPITKATDVEGMYMFIDLRPGTYTIAETQPAGWDDAKDVLGEVNGEASGEADAVDPTLSAWNDEFRTVVLPAPDSVGINYNFGERPPADGAVTGGQTATIGFWQNKNGQALIRELPVFVNGEDQPDTTIGDWLSATLPHMYGAGEDGVVNDDHELAGRSNDYVANFYRTLFLRKKKEAERAGLTGPVKMDAQAMAVALACYATNETLAGTTAESYDFLVTADGVGTSTFNVGTAGEAFGVANGSEVAILDLLLATDGFSWEGVLYDLDYDGETDDTVDGLGETLLRALANDIYSAINEAGDI